MDNSDDFTRRRNGRALLLAGAVLVIACGIDKTARQATAKDIVVATLLSTPPIPVSPEALAGNFVDFADAGFRVDAGVTDGGFVLGPQSALNVYFGQRQGDLLSLSLSGTAGAKAEVSQVSGGAVLLTDNGQGNYAYAGSEFQYQPNATYEVRITNKNTLYVADVKNVPPLERVEAFHPPAGFVTLQANTPFTFARAEPPKGQDRLPAFVTVFAVDGVKKGATTYTTLPVKPGDLLKLVLEPGAFKTAMVTVPATAFPEANRNYVLMLQSVKFGGPQTDNLFSASTVIAGSADVALIKTLR
jgi:hypothetical protein